MRVITKKLKNVNFAKILTAPTTWATFFLSKFWIQTAFNNLNVVYFLFWSSRSALEQNDREILLALYIFIWNLVTSILNHSVPLLSI